MIENEPDKRMPKPGLIMRILCNVAGVDSETLRDSPSHDWESVRASALLFVAVWIYQTGIFSLVGHDLFARDSQFHVTIVMASAFIATFILLIDSWAFGFAYYHRQGLSELRRVGLNLGGGFFANLKAWFFLALRILVLSLPIALLTGLCSGLVIFESDIAADQESRFQQQNAALIVKAREHVDAEIAAAGNAAAASEAQVDALQKQVGAMREGAVDGMAGNPASAAADEELRQLMAEKVRRDGELEDAQKFASGELAGLKLETGNTGKRGRGPVRKAAEERVQAARDNVRNVDQEIAAARNRLDNLSVRLASGAGDRSQKSTQVLPELERDLSAEAKNLYVLRQHLAALTAGRDREIRDEVENEPGSVKDSVGFLGQLRSLRRVARDPEIAAIIILIDLVTFGLELAAVLAKVTAYVPMEYTARLARDAYMRVFHIAEETDGELKKSSPNPERADDVLPPVSRAALRASELFGVLSDAPAGPAPIDPSASNGTTPNGFAAPKRPRGRPRKYPPPVTA